MTLSHTFSFGASEGLCVDGGCFSLLFSLSIYDICRQNMYWIIRQVSSVSFNNHSGNDTVYGDFIQEGITGLIFSPPGLTKCHLYGLSPYIYCKWVIANNSNTIYINKNTSGKRLHRQDYEDFLWLLVFNTFRLCS